MQMLYIWILAAVVFGVLEGITAQLVSIWFVLGAVAAAVAAACGGAVWLQGVLFVAVSVVALLATKPLVKKYLRPRIQATNADRCVGRTGVVLEDIDNLAATGQVRVCGSVWSARSTDGVPIAAGTTVVVDRNGRMVGEPILGGIDNEAQMKALQALIDEALMNDMDMMKKDGM